MKAGTEVIISGAKITVGAIDEEIQEVEVEGVRLEQLEKLFGPHDQTARAKIPGRILRIYTWAEQTRVLSGVTFADCTVTGCVDEVEGQDLTRDLSVRLQLGDRKINRLPVLTESFFSGLEAIE